MPSPADDLTFLQSFYGQDTLYVIPEESAGELAPGLQVPTGAPMQQDRATAGIDSLPANHLVKEEISAPPAENKTEEKILWLGEAVKGTYLLFQVPQNEFGQLPQHPFLEKVLKAVGLTTLQVQFGNLSTQITHNVKQIASEQQAKHILLFGDELTVENLLKLEPYRMYRLDQTRFVRVDSLANIEQNTDLKKKLWDVLQKIFLQ